MPFGDWIWFLRVIPGVRSIIRRFGMRVTIRNPLNAASEPFLRWWHVHVHVDRRWAWYAPDPLPHCSVTLSFDRSVRGVWSTHHGPQVEITLVAGGEPYSIPVVLRSLQACFIAGVPIPDRRAYVTDAEFLTQHQQSLVLTREVYNVKVGVHIGDRVIAEEKFFLEIRGNDLLGFNLTDWLNRL